MSGYMSDTIGLVAYLSFLTVVLAAYTVITANCSYRKVGGLHFMKLGRLTMSMSMSKVYKAL